MYFVWLGPMKYHNSYIWILGNKPGYCLLRDYKFRLYVYKNRYTDNTDKT